MATIEVLILISGVLHLGTLLGSVQVPRELRFKEDLAKLNPLLRHWVLVAGGYIVFNIMAFGFISILFCRELAAGSTIARVFCSYIAVFWAIRLAIQLFLFDPRSYLRNAWLKFGYHALTIVFAWQTVIYAWAATAR